MVVVPLSASESQSITSPRSASKVDDTRYWIRVAAAGSLAASGVLLMAGKRRAGLAVAATGTALTVIDQQENVRYLWNHLPGYLEEVQRMLSRVQGAVEELSAQGERLRDVFSR